MTLTVCSVRDASKAQVLDLEELLNSVLRSLAAETGFLHAAKGRDLRGDQASVDPDYARFEGLGHSPHTADGATVERRGQAEPGVVGHRDGLFLCLEAEGRGDRSEGRLARDHH